MLAAENMTSSPKFTNKMVKKSKLWLMLLFVNILNICSMSNIKNIVPIMPISSSIVVGKKLFYTLAPIGMPNIGSHLTRR